MKHTPTEHRNHSALGYLPRSNENICLYPDVCENAPGSFLHVSPHWKQPRCLSPGEWLNKRRNILAMEYYSTIKTRQLLITTKVNLQKSTPRGRSQTPARTSCTNPSMRHSRAAMLKEGRAAVVSGDKE